MNKKIYFAGSIRGGRVDAALYRRMIAWMREGDTVLTEHVGDLSLSPLEDGDYLYQYEVTDVFGRVTVSDSALMVCEAGEIYVYLDEEETEEFSFTRYRIP